MESRADRYLEGESVPPFFVAPPSLFCRIPNPFDGDPLPPADGYFLELPTGGPLSREEPLFELLCEWADRTVGRPLILALPVGDREEGRLREALRAILRAAVWGELSLLLGGLFDGASLERTLSLFSSCVCELRQEGREIDPYLPKGVLLDTPLLLFEERPLAGIDLLCLDVFRLFSRLTGGTLSQAAIPPTLRLLRRALSQAPSVQKSALLLSSASLSRELLSFLSEEGLNPWSLLFEEFENIENIFSKNP